jgi:hypothetical protein
LHQKLSTLQNLGSTPSKMLETLIGEKKVGGKEESKREQDKANVPVASVPVPVPGSPPSSPPVPVVIGSKFNVMAANQRLKERLANSIKSVTSSASMLSASLTPSVDKALPKVVPSEAEHGAMRSSADGMAPKEIITANGHGDENGAGGNPAGKNAIGGEKGTQPLTPEASRWCTLADFFYFFFYLRFQEFGMWLF